MKFPTLILACLTTISLQAELFFTPQMIQSHLKTYTEKEKQLIEKDLAVVRSVCLDGTQNAESRFYLATAGAPGARKTTILEKFMATHLEYQTAVYLDYEPRTLKFMAHTYYAQSLNALLISQVQDYDAVIRDAYNKWRWASHYIVLTLFEEAVATGRSIAFGTTSTGAHVPNFFAKLKEGGYKIVLLLCSGTDRFRYDAIKYRNEVIRFYQSSPEDALSKGKMFAQRMGAYFEHADLLYFYWSDELFSSERLAAVWEEGRLTVHDAEAMELFIKKYEEDRAALVVEGQTIPSFQSYLSKP